MFPVLCVELSGSNVQKALNGREAEYDYRSTFYRYFDTKDEMLREIEREYLEKTRSLTPAIHHYHPDASPEEMERYLK